MTGKAHINQDELTLLAFLHEHARGYTEDLAFDPDVIKTELQISEQQLQRDLSFLVAHNLAGRRAMNTTILGSPHPESILEAVWITGNGENYMRELEAHPGMTKRVTVSFVAKAWDKIQTIAITLLTAYLSKRAGL